MIKYLPLVYRISAVWRDHAGTTCNHGQFIAANRLDWQINEPIVDSEVNRPRPIIRGRLRQPETFHPQPAAVADYIGKQDETLFK